MILNILAWALHGLSTREIHTRLADRGFEVEMRTVYLAHECTTTL